MVMMPNQLLFLVLFIRCTNVSATLNHVVKEAFILPQAHTLEPNGSTRKFSATSSIFIKQPKPEMEVASSSAALEREKLVFWR